MPDIIRSALDLLSAAGYSFNDFLHTIINDSKYSDHKFLHNFQNSVNDILWCLKRRYPELTSPPTSVPIEDILTEELTELTRKDNGLHFTANNATFEQMETFRIEYLADCCLCKTSVTSLS